MRVRRPLEARRAAHRRPTASSRARSRRRCADDELLTEIVSRPARRRRVGVSQARASRPRATRSSGWPRSSASRPAARSPTARIGITGVGDVAYRAAAVEAALIGSDGSAAAIAAAAAHATDGQTVAGDIHADRAYRAADGDRLRAPRDRGRRSKRSAEPGADERQSGRTGKGCASSAS